MAIYKRGATWWYKFQFQGQPIRESAHTSNKDLAGRAERERRRALELGANHLEPVRKPLMFKLAAQAWLEDTPGWEDSTREINTLKVRHLMPRFRSMLLSDIKGAEIAAHQRARERDGAAPRTINMEISALRQILRKHRLWAALDGEVKMLREPEEIGRALEDDEMQRIHSAAAQSRSRSLPVAICVFENTGVRMAELRKMKWSQANLISRPGAHAGITTGLGSKRKGETRGKTKGGEGRFIPLNDDALAALKAWRANFPEAQPDHYVFPSERYGLRGDEGRAKGTRAVWNVDPTKPIGTWKTAWTTCRKTAGVQCRFHDLRHTFISRLGENRTPDATMTALGGWMSAKMKELYSHTRNEAKVRAVQGLNRQVEAGIEVGTTLGTIH